MKSNIKNKLKGSMHQAKGVIKEKAGRATHRGGMEAEGRVERIRGKVQKKAGQVQDVVED
jgi:uncharacterized protein YjbJ (UPF0337 family)